MTALSTLTRREIAERAPLLWGTLIAALVPLVVRILPGLRPALRRELHETLGASFGLVFPIALAVGLGASVVGEDLAQRRLGFHFARPVSGFAIWASKTLAAVLVTLLAWGAFVLPVVWLAADRITFFTASVERGTGLLLPWATSLLALIVLAQALAGAYRARDGLFALDLGLFAILASAAGALGWWLDRAEAHGTLVLVGAAALLVLVIASATGAAAQVVVGRTDARRGHLALSACLWGTMLLGLAGAAAFGAWVLSVSPAAVGVAQWGLITTPTGSPLAFLGARHRAGYQPMFLLDPSTGHFERHPAHRFFGFFVSGDGHVAAWVEPGRPATLARRALDGAGTTTRSTLPEHAGNEPRLSCLSPTGGEVVLTTTQRMTVVDTSSGREIASAVLTPSGASFRCSFSGGRIVAFSLLPAGPLTVTSFAPRTAQVRPGPVAEGVELVRTIRDGRALVTGRRGSLALVDETRVRWLVPPAEGSPMVASAAFLSDGRAAAVLGQASRKRVRVWDQAGTPTLDLPAPGDIWFIGNEPRPGWVSLVRGSGALKAPATLFLDLESGTVVREEEGLTPAAGWGGQALPPGSPGSRLFTSARGELVRLDPETGRREAVLVPAPPGPAD